MEQLDQQQTMLNLMERSAFRVENGVITHVNPAAARYLLRPGMEVSPLLATGRTEYADFTGDSMYLTLSLEGVQLGATVMRMEQAQIFVLEDADAIAQLRTLSLAALEMRTPLAGAIAATDRMLPAIREQGQTEVGEYAAQLNRRLMQLQRMISNMSDCAGYANPNPKLMEYTQICAMLDELLSKAADMLAKAKLRLEYSLPEEPIYLLCYPQKLERAVYNLLSNAAKFSPANGTIFAQLRRNGNQLSFSVTDQGSGSRQSSDIFTRYLRQPALEDGLQGIGLGMALIRSVATVHGGVVLIDHPETGGTRVTLTLRIPVDKRTEVRSNILRIDYAGERDHCLLELSDVLPAALYRTDGIN